MGNTYTSYTQYFEERDPTNEEEGQIDFVNWLHRYYPEVHASLFHVPNGGKRARRTAGRMKLLGVKRGVPDIVILLPRAGKAGLVLELKRSVGSVRASAEQYAWLGMFEASGFVTAVCRVSEAPLVVESYLNL